MEALSLHLRNFTSWERLDVSLQRQGFVAIIGENGAGKSSIPTALHWALYGTTPEPIRADEVRRTRKPTIVRVVFRQGGHRYTVTRYRHHPHYGNKVMFTGYGVPQTVEDSHTRTVQALIVRTFGMSETLFRSTTFFAQGHFRMFHGMTDYAKKAYIESLTYNSLFEQCEKVTRDRLQQVERERARLEGQIAGLAASITTLTQQDLAHQQETQVRIQACHAQVAMYDTCLAHVSAQLRSHEKTVDVLHRVTTAVTTAERQLYEAAQDMHRYSQPEPVCPTCGLVMLENLRPGRLGEAQRRHATWQGQLEKVQDQYAKAFARYQVYEGLEKTYTEYSQRRAENLREITFLEQSLARVHDLRALQDDYARVRHALRVQQRHLQYLQFWVKGFGFQGLRSMVLTRAVLYLGERVRVYLQQLVRERLTFHLSLEETRLVTECNGRSFGALSGGEKQALDLCTGFALRDLAEHYNKCQSNLLIADEPFESLNDALTARAQDLLRAYAKPSTLLITHRPLSVPFDKVYQVTGTPLVPSTLCRIH